MEPINFDPGTEPRTWEELFAMSDEFRERETRPIPNIIRLPNLTKKQEERTPGWAKLAAHRLESQSSK